MTPSMQTPSHTEFSREIISTSWAHSPQSINHSILPDLFWIITPTTAFHSNPKNKKEARIEFDSRQNVSDTLPNTLHNTLFYAWTKTPLQNGGAKQLTENLGMGREIHFSLYGCFTVIIFWMAAAGPFAG